MKLLQLETLYQIPSCHEIRFSLFVYSLLTSGHSDVISEFECLPEYSFVYVKRVEIWDLEGMVPYLGSNEFFPSARSLHTVSNPRLKELEKDWIH